MSNLRFDKLRAASLSLNKDLSDATKLVLVFDDLYNGFVNSGVSGGSTVLFKSAAEMLDGTAEFTYGTHGTPIVDDLCIAINMLECADYTMLTSSGLLALTSSFLSVLRPGDHALVVDSCYEPLRNFCNYYLKNINVDIDYYNPADIDSLKSLLKQNTRLVYLESPGSGTFEIQDVSAICQYVNNFCVNCLIVMDNTWSTPLLFKPILHGVDLSVHAMTKYPSGCSDVMLGSVSASSRGSKVLESYKAYSGVCNGDYESYLVLRGLKSMWARLNYHHEMALKIVSFLKTVDCVADLFCPAESSFGYYNLWKRDYTKTNSIFSFVIQCPTTFDTTKLCKKFLDNLCVFGLGWSWGGYKSLAAPVKLEHRLFAPKLCGPLIRLQVGFECVDDLLWDLERAFKAL